MKLLRLLKGQNLTVDGMNGGNQSKSITRRPALSSKAKLGENLLEIQEPPKALRRNVLPSPVKQVFKLEQHKPEEIMPLQKYIESLFKCMECEAFFIRKSALAAHMQVHDDSKLYHCTECGISFNQKSSFSNHMRNHSSEKLFRCLECGCGYKNAMHLQQHARRHQEDEPHICSVCGESFIQFGDLMQHSHTHSEAKLHLCEVCGKKFSRGSTLRVHEMSHSNMKPFKCKLCGTRFTQRGNLQVHMRRHSGEKPHVCLECGKAFAHSQSLQVHLRVHSGNRPYQCTVEGCSAAFADTGTLYKHRNIHSEVRPHVCEFCHVAFAQRANMRRHVKVMHKVELPQLKRRSVTNLKTKSAVDSKPTMKAQLKEKERALFKKNCVGRVKLFRCKFCGERFVHRTNLQNHVRCHGDSKNDISTSKDENLSQTENEEQLSLLLEDDCSSSDSVNNQREHVGSHEQYLGGVIPNRSVNSYNAPSQMNACSSEQLIVDLLRSNKIFEGANQENLVQEEDAQEVVKVVKCTLCNRCFAEQVALQEHMNSHSHGSIIAEIVTPDTSNCNSQLACNEQGRRRKQKMPKKKVDVRST